MQELTTVVQHPIALKATHVEGGGEMGERIRNFDWAKTPIGPPESWSQSLRGLINLMLANRFPMILWWGKEYIQFYNDAYIPIPGLKHPAKSLGQPASECWKEIWPVIGPLIDTPFYGGPPTWMDDIQLQVNRNNFVEETHFTIAYSPVPDTTVPSGIGGVLATVNEITQSVISKRQMETLRQLGKNISAILAEDEVYTEAARVLSSNPFDIPFALVYKIENVGTTARLIASSGVDNKSEFPQNVNIHNPLPNSRNISKAVLSNEIVESKNNGRWQNLPKGAWDVMPEQFVHTPLKAANKKFPNAILTIGLSPYRKFDEDYKNFIQLISDQISLAVKNAQTHEEERKKAEALAELDKAKTIFFSNISHEFRTPLTLMLGPLEEVLHDPATLPQNRERISVSHRNAMRLLRLVNNLLDFSRIEAGRMKAFYQLTDIAKLTTDLASTFRSVIENAGLQFEVACDHISQPVYIDKGMWEKIVLNLLSNAFKYTLKGKIGVSLILKDGRVELKVSDTGVGIPKEELPKMFQRFHRVQNVTGRTYEGSGIGLSLVKELVKLHGGEISVTSNVGKGSEFAVSIPTGKKHLSQDQLFDEETDVTTLVNDTFIEAAETLIANHTVKEIRNNRSNHSSTILIVDDNADMREYLAAILATSYNVHTAKNGLDALEKLKTDKPSLILTDVMMPVMDGIQLLKQVKDNKDTTKIPVVLLTARAGEESRIEGYEIGADDYLVKPFSAKELLARIRAQIDISRKRHLAEEGLEKEVTKRTRELDEQNILLRKQNTLVKKILDSSIDAIVVYDTDTRILSINQASLKIFGGKEEEVMGQKLLDVIPQLKDSKGYKDLLRAINGETIHNEIYRSPLSGRYFQNSLVPLKDESDKIYAVLAIAHDNTDLIATAERLKVKNEELQSTQSFLEQLIDSSVEFVSVLDKELQFITVNKKYEQAMGLLRKDVIGKHLFEINPEVKDTVQHESILRALKGETVYLDKRMAISRPGYALDTYFIPLAIHNRVEGIIVMSRDVTDILKSEQALQQKNKELTEAQKLALLGSWEWNLANGELSWSDTMYNIYGIVPSEGISFEKFSSLLHPADKDNVEKMIASAKKNKRFEEFFHRIITPTGAIKTLHARGEVITDENGHVIKMIGTGQDVTSQLQLVEQLKKLSESDQLKSDFIKMASHELKTPITSIKGYLQLLLTVMKESEQSKLSPLLLKSSLTSIEKQVDKLTRLLSELLDLSRIESGQLTLNKEEFNFNELVIDAIQDVLYTQPKHSINLYHDYYSTVSADKDRITQVIINLLNNAIKYSPDSSKIDVTIHQPKKDYVAVSVKDYGIGIDKQHQGRIFDRFYRAEGESEQTYPGFGIGLFIASEIIQRHHGSISLTSEKGEGSVFTFTLPVRSTK